jgi:hypothetical protein
VVNPQVLRRSRPKTPLLRPCPTLSHHPTMQSTSTSNRADSVGYPVLPNHLNDRASVSNRRITRNTRIIRVILLSAMLSILYNAQECRIISFTHDGYLTLTNYPASLYCGLLRASALDDCWLPAPSPYWNFRTTNATTTLQLPMDKLPSPSFLRLACSSNPLTNYYPQFQVPFASISVDGSPSNWSSIQPALTDRTGDAAGPTGSDMTAVYVARDANNAYIRIDVNNGPPASSLYFGVSFYTNATSQAGDRFVFINLGGFTCSVEKRQAAGSGYHDFVASGVLAVQGNIIEASVPLSALNPPAPSFVNAWDDTNGPAIDTVCPVQATFP